MAVPEAAIDEDDRAVLAEDDVGRTRQTLHVDAVSEATGKEIMAHKELGLGVAAPDMRHTFVALVLGEFVGHGVTTFPQK